MIPSLTLNYPGQGVTQFSAGASLVVSSGLLQWNYTKREFSATKPGDFQLHWSKFDKIYGRAAMWNIFSTGAELMLKGFLMEGNRLTAEPKKVLTYPIRNKNLDNWALETLKTPYQKRKTQTAYGYGTIAAALTKYREIYGIDTVSKLGKLTSGEFEVFVAASYELLRDSIRNRDTHAYVPNVRATHEWLANGMFLKTFNILLGHLDDKARKEISKSVANSRPQV